MKFSIITPVLNNDKTIERTIKKVKKFTNNYNLYEHIIVDGGSTDYTLDVINKNNHDNLKIIIDNKSGIYKAINTGIKFCTGDIVSILGSGDFYNEKDFSLIKLKDTFLSKNLDIIYGNANFFLKNNIDKIIRIYNSGNFSPNKIEWGFMPAHQSMFIKKEVYNKFGLYNETFKICADYEFVARIYKNNNLKDFFLDQVCTFMEYGGSSNGNIKKLIKVNMEIVRGCKMNGYNTNYLKIYSKYFSKIKEFIKK